MIKRLMNVLAVSAAVLVSSAGFAKTTIHLDEYNGYFAAKETLSQLPAGEYTFIVSNKAGKVVGFQLQELGTNKPLEMFPLEPGETRETTVTVSDKGFRYRCPINPTPWYEVNVK